MMILKAIPNSLFIALASLSVMLSGCAISTPFPKIHSLRHNSAGSPVVLVMTRIIINPQERQEFDRHTSEVMRALGNQPGLIGYSARRQLFGDEGWTLSIWEDEQALNRFVRSAEHTKAIEKSMSAVISVDIKRLNFPLKDVPPEWTRALGLLAQPCDIKTYGW